MTRYPAVAGALALFAGSLPGCAQLATGPAPALSGETAVVTATRETEAVQTANADAADDPAIWRNAADPAASLIVATDKQAGLNVYDLQGRQRHFLNAGRVNNVDLVETAMAGTPIVLVAASDRNDLAAAKIALFRLDTASARLEPLGTVPAGTGEAYGICLGRRPDGAVDAFVVLKDGTINQVALDLRGSRPAGRIIRTLKLPSQSEGCVVDPATQRLYVAEEDVGIWRFDARPGGDATPVSVARVDNRTLVADVEGLAISRGHDGRTLLVASSQGDSVYAVYDLADDRFVGRFRIGAGELGATSETDGIEIGDCDFGPDFPAGILIAQDGNNAPRAQNFKMVSWGSVLEALARR
ncbi:phytase [Sphingomonas aracearum]|uniref:3-phytase n=1 Tax=Sphingomonas aracearum TaxID=2283317 RepID=A0A369VYC2_9SPHN|nr:phytase [Sphingomonas aracearum]RDE06052.1 3-phytase [Sphingomonas aracearum]